MSLYRQIQSVKAQLVDTEQMLQLVGDHPLMSHSLSEKIKYLKNKLQELPKDLIEAKLKLLFSGNAVVGSKGIKSSFVSKTILPIQALVKTQATLIRFGNISKRGQAKKGATSELYLTALPVGSFGYELSQLETNDLFDETDISTSIRQVVSLIELTTKGDEAFEKATENVPKRSLNHLKKFFKEVADENSILKMETGDLYIELSDQAIKEGYTRVAAAATDEDEVFINGVVRGFLLDSGKFEIVDDNGKRYSGFISEQLSEEEVIQYDQKYLNKRCRIHLQVVRTKFSTGNERISYELLSVSDIQ